MLQLHFIRLLGCARITVVGDDDQSIYGFRGAQPEIFNTLRQMIAPLAVREVVLSTNYRSTNVILEACSAVVAHNKRRRQKEVQSHNRNGARGTLLHVCACRTIECEAAYVADQILDYQRQGVPLSSIAVLHRIRSVGPSITKTLAARKVPYQLRATGGGGGDGGGGGGDGVRGRLGSDTTSGRAMSLLRFLANPWSQTQFKLVCNSAHYRQGLGLANATRDAVLGIGRAGSGNLLDAARTLLQLPLGSPAYAGLPAQGTKRSLGEMLQSIDQLGERVASMRSAADGLRYALDYVRSSGGGSSGGASSSSTASSSSSTSSSSSLRGGFAYDYQTNQLLQCADVFSAAARTASSSSSSGGGSLFAADDSTASGGGGGGGGDTGLAESNATGMALLREFLDHVSDLEHEDAPLPVGAGGGTGANKRKKAGGGNSKGAGNSKGGSGGGGGGGGGTGKVTVSTVHRAKGMEWEVVFVVRMNEGVLPLHTRRHQHQHRSSSSSNQQRQQQQQQQRRRQGDPAAAGGGVTAGGSASNRGDGDDEEDSSDGIDEEERRIAYVAMSRARNGTSNPILNLHSLSHRPRLEAKTQTQLA